MCLKFIAGAPRTSTEKKWTCTLCETFPGAPITHNSRNVYLQRHELTKHLLYSDIYKSSWCAL